MEDDQDLRTKALEHLDDTVKEMNSHLYEFNKVVETGITLTADTEEYQLDTAFYRESLAYIVQTSTGNRGTPMIYLPWAHLQRLTLNDPTTFAAYERPTWYSVRNVQDDGLVTLRPAPDSSTATDYTLTIEYYRRIPLISSVAENDSINVPQEVEVALIYGAQKRMSIHLQGAGHEDTQALYGLEERALQRLQAVDKTHPDEQMRFRIVDFAFDPQNRRRGELFIRIK